jgi:hypothetical protein
MLDKGRVREIRFGYILSNVMRRIWRLDGDDVCFLGMEYPGTG